mgnify:CR=1 FL=1
MHWIGSPTIVDGALELDCSSPHSLSRGDACYFSRIAEFSQRPGDGRASRGLSRFMEASRVSAPADAAFVDTERCWHLTLEPMDAQVYVSTVAEARDAGDPGR